MTVKNKLYKHHKSKFVLVARNLSIALSSFVAIVALAAIPTYFSSNSDTEVQANNTVVEAEPSEGVNENEEPLESYFAK